MHSLKIFHSSWGVSKDHKRCSRCVSHEDLDVQIFFEENDRRQGGGERVSWCPPQHRSQFVHHPLQNHQQPASSPLSPIQAFHADFPNYLPALGYPLAAYFSYPISQAQMMNPQQTPAMRSSNQMHQQAENMQNSISTRPRPSITPMGVPVMSASQIKTEPGEETADWSDFKGSDRVYLKTLNALDVRVRNDRKRRAPLFDIAVPEMPVGTGQSTNGISEFNSNKSMILQQKIKQELFTPPRVSQSDNSYANYAPQRVEKELAQPQPRAYEKQDVSVKQEFHRKIKEAAKNDNDFLNRDRLHQGTIPKACDVEKTKGFPVSIREAREVSVTNDKNPQPQGDIVGTREKVEDTIKPSEYVCNSNLRLAYENLYNAGRLPLSKVQEDKNIAKVQDDVVDSGHTLKPNENASIAAVIEPKEELDYSSTTSGNVDSELSTEQFMNQERDSPMSSPCNKSSTVCLDTETMQLETDTLTTVTKRRGCADYSEIFFIASEYHDTEDWKNTAWRISNNRMFEASAIEFVQELVIWAINKSDAEWQKVTGSIIRLMIKTGMTEKRKVLEMLAMKFIDDRPESSLTWAVISPRLVRVLVDAFFNEGNFDWLYDLRLLCLQSEYNLTTWRFLADHVVRILKIRTNMDFVLNLANQTTFKLPEILPALQDPEAEDFPKVVASAPCSSTNGFPHNGQHATCPTVPSSVYSSEILEASAMLSTLRLEDVKCLIMTKPLFSPPLDVTSTEDDRIEVVRQNVYLLAKLLHNSADLLIILHHYGVISSTDNMELNNVSSEFHRFVGILAAAVRKDKTVFRTFLNVLRRTNNIVVADILDPPNGMLARDLLK